MLLGRPTVVQRTCEVLGLDTLDGSDCLEISVVKLREALEEAFQIGRYVESRMTCVTCGNRRAEDGFLVHRPYCRSFGCADQIRMDSGETHLAYLSWPGDKHYERANGR